jgi:hypothetical protein
VNRRGVRRWCAAGLVALIAVPLAGCGDDSPAFCDDLGQVRSLSALDAALERRDLTAAATEADRLTAVADAAPSEISAQMQALVAGLQGVVSLLQAQQANQDPGAIEAQREELNTQLGTLADDVAAVSQWSEEQCGFRLS